MHYVWMRLSRRASWHQGYIEPLVMNIAMGAFSQITPLLELEAFFFILRFLVVN